MRRGFMLAGLLGLGLGLGCGGRTVHRPVELFVTGLSGQAETLSILLFPGSAGVTCGEVTLQTVQGLEAPFRADWSRGVSEAREVSLPEIDEDEATLVAYAEDAGGAVIQLACRELTYAELESPELSLQLSARPR